MQSETDSRDVSVQTSIILSTAHTSRNKVECDASSSESLYRAVAWLNPKEEAGDCTYAEDGQDLLLFVVGLRVTLASNLHRPTKAEKPLSRTPSLSFAEMQQ